ncbi:MAG: hypothetical protein KR126chlam6_00685 [Candidatus Anoxychlamydiales bacterium]|nr:hypothetical protein [Candidatus Anoxychlamydiales bacterium]
MTLPLTYSSRKQNLINNISIYKFLRDEKVPESYLNASRFNISFLTFDGEEKGKLHFCTEYNAIRINTGLISLPLIDCGSKTGTKELSDETWEKDRGLFEKAFVRA